MVNWIKPKHLIFTLPLLIMLVSCGNPETGIAVETATPEPKPTNAEASSEPTLPSAIKPTEATPTGEPTPAPEIVFEPLPERSGPRTQTSGTVPHVQIGVALVDDVNDRLFELAFSLPNVENRPTIISLPGARGMWISEGVSLAHAENIVSGREFAHIHPDGSLHLALPYARALEAVEKGWAERHPWADEREGWEGFVMLFTPLSMTELEVTFQLIVESYKYITGEEIEVAELAP